MVKCTYHDKPHKVKRRRWRFDILGPSQDICDKLCCSRSSQVNTSANESVSEHKTEHKTERYNRLMIQEILFKDRENGNEYVEKERSNNIGRERERERERA